MFYFTVIQTGAEETKFTPMVGHMPRVSVADWCHDRVLQYFDPNCLSDPETQITMQVNISETGLPSCKIIESKHCSESDKFYCEQAMWEAAPIVPFWAHDFEGTEFSCKYSKRQYSANHWPELIPSKGSNVVVMHLRPASSIGGSDDGAHFSSAANTVKLRTDKLQDNRLNQFRLDWIRFLEQCDNPIPQVLNDRANTMRLKYSGLFESK